MGEEKKPPFFVLDDEVEVTHFKTLLNPAQIEVINRDKIAHNVNSDYSTRHSNKEAVFIGILNGCYTFMSQLTNMLSIKAEVDFMRLKSFKDGKRSDIKLLKDIELDIKDKVVYLIDEINDTGQTFIEAIKILELKQPLRMYTISLLTKKHTKLPSDYNGMMIPNDMFVYGYGLDDENGLNRNNKSIYWK
jgi:hypoxanthine phosphoribosyltransferase